MDMAHMAQFVYDMYMERCRSGEVQQRQEHEARRRQQAAQQQAALQQVRTRPRGQGGMAVWCKMNVG